MSDLPLKERSRNILFIQTAVSSSVMNKKKKISFQEANSKTFVVVSVFVFVFFLLCVQNTTGGFVSNIPLHPWYPDRLPPIRIALWENIRHLFGECE